MHYFCDNEVIFSKCKQGGFIGTVPVRLDRKRNATSVEKENTERRWSREEKKLWHSNGMTKTMPHCYLLYIHTVILIIKLEIQENPVKLRVSQKSSVSTIIQWERGLTDQNLANFVIPRKKWKSFIRRCFSTCLAWFLLYNMYRKKAIKTEVSSLYVRAELVYHIYVNKEIWFQSRVTQILWKAHQTEQKRPFLLGEQALSSHARYRNSYMHLQI